MLKYVFIAYLLVLCFAGSYQKSRPDSTFYTAAVVEYSPISEVESDGIQGLVAKNVHNYIQFVEAAAQQGADIIVFPEVGLVSYGKGVYASPIPDPHDHANPCSNNSAGMLEQIVQLSCAARRNDIYVVINFPEVKICEEIVPASDCEHNGTFYYNSNIVFDRNGYVVARYRKYNLFLEPEFNKTPKPEMSFFETDFGVRFGMFTCFDIMFKSPAVALVEQFNVTDVAVPQAWFSELPFLTALQSQSQWAYAMNVNLLAAGYSKPSVGSTGSGIYNGRDGPLVTIFSNVNTSKLLMANVSKKVVQGKAHTLLADINGNNLPHHERPHENDDDVDPLRPVCWSNSVSSEHTYMDECIGSNHFMGSNESSGGLHLMKENLLAYTTLPLDVAKFDGTREKNISSYLCSDKLCCNFTVHTSFTSSESEVLDEESYYRTVVYSGMRSFAGAADAGIQVCGIIFCTGERLSTCGLPPSRVNVARPTFNYIIVTGHFNASNAIQMPNAMEAGYKITSSQSYVFTRNMIEGGKVNVTLQAKEGIRNLLSFGIYGRYFDNDVLH